MIGASALDSLNQLVAASELLLGVQVEVELVLIDLIHWIDLIDLIDSMDLIDLVDLNDLIDLIDVL